MKKLVAMCAGAALALLMGGAVQAGLNDGLVAYYPFNGNAQDESGNGNHGTVVGPGLTQDRYGNTDSAYRFDGVDDFIEVPDNDLLSFGDGAADAPFAFSAWIKPDQDQISYLFSKYNTSVSPFRQEYLISYINAPGVMIYDTTSDMRRGVRAVSAMEMAWSHLLVVYDGSGLTAGMKLYVDGVEQQTEIVFNHPGYVAMHNTSEPFRIGGVVDSDSNGNVDNVFLGAIDDVRIYNRALLPSEIRQLFCPDEAIDAAVKPHDFSAGTPAKAGEVNENFDVLYERINMLTNQVQALKNIVCQDNPSEEICSCE